MIYKIKRYVLILSIYLTLSVYIQFAENIKFRHITKDSGLSNNSIYSFLQDSHGFIWIGTADGLNRYDGYNFNIYKHSPSDPFSINTRWITSLCEDQSGIIWIGSSSGGVGKFDPNKKQTIKYYSNPNNEFSLCSNYIRSICMTENGDIWIGTRNGLNKYIPDKDNFLRINHIKNDNSSLSNDSIRVLLPDRNNLIWIGTENGLNRFDIDKNFFKSYKKNKTKNSISNSSVISLYKDSKEMLWIGTRNGLNKFNIATEEFKHFYIKTKSDEFRGNQIYAITGDKNKIWFTAFLKGLYCLEKQTGIIKHFKNDIYDPQSLINDQILKLYKDKSGIIWVGTWANGISYFHPDIQFSHYYHKKFDRNSLSTKEVFAICEDNKGFLWIALFNGGINRLDPITNTFTHYLMDPLKKNSLSSNRIITIKHDMIDTLWIGHRETGLTKFNIAKNKYEHYSLNKKTLSSNTVRGILVDSNKDIWIGTANGLNKYIKKTDNFKKYYNNPANKNSLVHNYILSVIEDEKGFLWIGTVNGLSKMDKKTETFKNYYSSSTEPFYISTINNDSKDYLWLGLQFKGLGYFNKNNGKLKIYSIKDGLPSDKIVGIIKDKNNNLWISTKNGLVKFNIKQKKFKTYKKSDGIQSDEFIEGAFYKSSKGILYFGGYNGLTVFNPKNIKDNYFSPPLKITKIEIYPGKKRIIQNLPTLKVLNLNYTDTTIFISFAALDYLNPKKNRYAYKLEPIQKEWLDLENRNELSLTNLNPGNYILKIKGSNSDGIWNKKEILLNINITPPFWKTLWFKGIFFIFSVFLLFYLHKNRLKKQEEKLRSEAYIKQFCIKNKITDREIEIIELILKGKTNKEMENILFITEGTVKNHIYNIFKKLNVKNRTQLAGLLSDWKKINRFSIPKK